MHPQSTYGARCRLIQAITTVIILALPFLNVLRLDIPTLRFYFLSSVLWVDEFYLLFLVLMLLLWMVVIFSMIYGRVWCGWACPQMVLCQLVRWLEKQTGRLIGYGPKKSGIGRRILLRTLVAVAVAAVSLAVGFNLVSYFVDPYRMLAGIADGTLAPLVGRFIVGIAIIVFVDVVFWRETFCRRACPYGMMQVLLIDSKTQIMRYDKSRADDCIGCNACVKGCVMGIDIRTSPYQTECVYCGDCVDACNSILRKQDKPGLISFSWGEKNTRERWYEKLGLVDTKRWIVLGLTLVYSVGLVALVHARQPLSVTASGDRSTLFREAEDGRIYNDYSVRLENRSLEDGCFSLECALPGGGNADLVIHVDGNPFSLASREARTLRLSVSSGGESFHPGPNRIFLRMTSTENAAAGTETEIVFFMPDEWSVSR
jgi:cytochrome c oxidase accessory protein FixG